MTEIVYPNLPKEVYRNELLGALRGIGLDPAWMISLHLEHAQVEIKYMLKNEHGHAFYGGNDQVASVTVRLPVTDRVLMGADPRVDCDLTSSESEQATVA